MGKREDRRMYIEIRLTGHGLVLLVVQYKLLGLLTLTDHRKLGSSLHCTSNANLTLTLH